MPFPWAIKTSCKVSQLDLIHSNRRRWTLLWRWQEMQPAAWIWMRTTIRLLSVTGTYGVYCWSVYCINVILAPWAGHQFLFTFCEILSHDPRIQDKGTSGIESHILTWKQLGFPEFSPRACLSPTVLGRIGKVSLRDFQSHEFQYDLVYGEGILLDPWDSSDPGTSSGAWWIYL